MDSDSGLENEIYFLVSKSTIQHVFIEHQIGAQHDATRGTRKSLPSSGLQSNWKHIERMVKCSKLYELDENTWGAAG